MRERSQARSVVIRYGVAVAAVALAFLIRALLAPLVQGESPFLLLSAAVLLSAVFGGLGPGLLATVLGGVIGDYLFLPPVRTFVPPTAEHGLRTGLFLAQGFAISAIGAALASARWRAESSAREAREDRDNLRESEERYRLLVESVRDYSIFLVGEDGRVAEWNAGAERLFGYRGEEILGEPFSVIFTPEDVEQGAPERELEQALLEERGEDERRHVRKDGSRFWASGFVRPVYDPEGNLRGFSKVARDITERKRNEDALRLLAETGAALASSLDYRATLSSLTRLVVSDLADWCAVDVLNKGTLERLAVAHQDPEKVALAHELQRRYPPDPEAPYGVPMVIRSGEAELVPEIPEGLLEEASRDEGHREILRELGLRSYICVPLVARGRTLGALTLVSAESGRLYDQVDLELAEELARRAALAVDNARLYEIAREEITERERAEEKYRSIFENTIEGIFQSTPEGRILTANPAMARMFGYGSPEEMVASVSDAARQLYVDPDRRREFVRLIEQHGAISDFEAEVYRKDGGVIWASANVRAVRDEGAELVALEGTVEDITERKRAEEERGLLLRREQEARQRVTDIVESISDAFYTLDRQWRITYINPQGASTARMPREELIGRSLWEVFPELVGTELHEKFHCAMSERVFVGFEWRYAPYDVWVAPRIYPSAEGLSVFVQDITEGKRAEEARRENEERYHAVIEQAGEGIFLFDTETKRILETNPAFQRMLGYTPEELARVSIYELVPDVPRSVDENVERVVAQGHLLVGERHYLRKDGSWVELEVSGTVVSYGGERVVCAVARDITERRRAEEALRKVREDERNRMARDLHDGVLQDLTYALAEAQIVQVLLEEIELGADSELGARMEQTVEVLRRGGVGLRGAVLDLRLGEEQDRPFFRLLEFLVDQNRRMGPALDIRLGIEREVPSAPFGAEGTELLRALQEALTNVRRHAEAQSVRIRVKVEGGDLVAEVADDGRGFEPGTREGVGFRSMRERMSALGGKFEARNKPGEGTEVRFRIPVSVLTRSTPGPGTASSGNSSGES